MRWSPRSLGSYGLNIAIIAIFAVFLGFALIKLLQVERQMRLEASENMLWVVSQTQREALLLDATVGRYGAELATLDDIHLRFDLLLSRLNLLRDPPQRDMLARLGALETLEALADQVDELEAILASLSTHDTEARQQIAATLDPLHYLLVQTANTAMFAEWDELGDRLDEAGHATWQIIASVIMIMIAGALLSVRLVVTLARSRRAEASLRNVKQFSERVVGASGEGILAVDQAYRCTLWNPAMQAQIPVPATQALGQPLASISGIFAVANVRDAIAAGLAGERRECRAQPYFAHPAAPPRYLDLLCSPLLEGEQVIGALIFVRDVTEQHTAAQTLARAHEDLERLVTERTVDLQQTQEQLMAALQDLERALANERNATEFYRGFAATISHQFRTPLAVIDSAAQRLLRRGDRVTPDEVTERANRIRTNILRLTHFIQATLDAARLETGQIELRTQECDLTRLVLSARDRQAELTPERTADLKVEAHRSVLALGDPTLLEHILTNLLSNAVKYSARDTPVRLRVGTSESQAWCEVGDHGVGIPETEMPRLFERFFRASTGSDMPGTGIGLSLSRELARLQAGNITVTSRVGEGSTFTLWLPLSAGAIANGSASPGQAAVNPRQVANP